MNWRAGAEMFPANRLLPTLSLMKRLLLALVLTGTLAHAETSFPGLKGIMTPEEQRRAGLDQLTPDQLSILDTAILKFYNGTLKSEVTYQAGQMARQLQQEDQEKSFLSRIGLPDFSSDWQSLPILKGKVTGWVGGNSFKLDNGQVWEGIEPIPFELVNREVAIEPRPGGHFSLTVEGKNTTVRVVRKK